MRFGFGAAAACAGTSVNYEALVAAFDLKGWWRGSWSASPWTGTASAGSSGSNNLTEATNPPGTSALGGFNAADFDGTNDKLTGGVGTVFYATAAQYGWALVNVDAINTNDANWGLNDPIEMSSGTLQSGVILRDASGTITVEFHIETGTHRVVTTPLTTGAWTLVQWQNNGTTMKIRTNRNSWVSGTGGSLSAISAARAVGWGGAGGAFMDGKIMELAMTGASSSSLSDANFDTVCDYVNQRYGLAL